MKKYKQLTAAVLLSCATMLAPFHAEAAHEAVYKFSDDGKTMSVYIVLELESVYHILQFCQ